MRIHPRSWKEGKVTPEVAFKVEIIIINTPSAVAPHQKGPQEKSESKLLLSLSGNSPYLALPCLAL